MKWPLRRWGPGSIAASIALGLSLLVLAASASDAIRIREVEAAPGSTPSPARPRTPPATRPIPNAMETAVAHNPFSATRRPPAPAPPPATEPTRTAGPLPSIAGIGTAPGGRAFVIAAYPGSPSRVVRRGGRIGTWTLTAVDGAAATFASESGDTVVVRLPRGGSR